jgi:hypothetical protein
MIYEDDATKADYPSLRAFASRTSVDSDYLMAHIEARDALTELNLLRRVVWSDVSHKVSISSVGWYIEHPIQERLQGSLFDCPVHQKAIQVGASWEFHPDGVFWLDDDCVIGQPA